MPKHAVVERWYRLWDNPMKPVALVMREIILAADERMQEQLKWQAPTFVFEGNLATFFPGAKKHASLMFHLGARIPGEFPHLEGSGDTSRVMKIASVEEAEAARGELTAIVKAWCKWRLAESVRPPARKSASASPSAKKASPKKTPPKKAPAKNAPPKKAPSKKAPPKKAPAERGRAKA